jgi:hypothetical protein
MLLAQMFVYCRYAQEMYRCLINRSTVHIVTKPFLAKFLLEVPIKIKVFWDVTSYRLINSSERFGRAYSLHLQGI